MANFVKKNVSFSISINPKEYGVNAEKYELVEITPQGKTPMQAVSGVAKLKVKLQPSSLKVIEIVPVSK
jgi:hypothetical protein